MTHPTKTNVFIVQYVDYTDDNRPSALIPFMTKEFCKEFILQSLGFKCGASIDDLLTDKNIADRDTYVEDPRWGRVDVFSEERDWPLGTVAVAYQYVPSKADAIAGAPFDHPFEIYTEGSALKAFKVHAKKDDHGKVVRMRYDGTEDKVERKGNFITVWVANIPGRPAYKGLERDTDPITNGQMLGYLNGVAQGHGLRFELSAIAEGKENERLQEWNGWHDQKQFNKDKFPPLKEIENGS
jgi:hypothetical protein